MTFTAHENIQTPSGETMIWRYMDFTKFLSFIDKQASFFCRADFMDDRYEGSLSAATLDPLRMWDMVMDYYGTQMANDASERAQTSIKNHFLNCWHMNNYESAAMWKVFAKTNEAIAIQSRVWRLKSSFNNIRPNIYVGRVKYVDYDVDKIPNEEPLLAYFHKRKSFEYEQELRAVFVNDPNTQSYDSSLLEKPGLYFHSYIESLIESVYVAPESPLWFRDLVKSVTTKYGLEVNVINSRLDETPVY